MNTILTQLLAEDIPINWAQTGLIGSLVLGILWTGFKQKWLFYWLHERIVTEKDRQLEMMTTEKDEWKRMALAQVGVIEDTVDRTAAVAYRSAEWRLKAMDERLRTQAVTTGNLSFTEQEIAEDAIADARRRGLIRDE